MSTLQPSVHLSLSACPSDILANFYLNPNLKSLNSPSSSLISPMDSQNLKQRSRDDPAATTTTTTTITTDTNEKNRGNRREKRMAMAKRGLRSLVIAVSFPLSLTLLDIYLFGSGRSYYNAVAKPFWFPPSWLLHIACLVESFVMGLSAWFVWAEGGFHVKPTAFSLYLAYLGLSLAWLPTVFWMGSGWAGLVLSLAMVGTLVGCSRDFGKVNQIAGNLVMPCLAWAAYLSLVNLKLVFL